MPSVDLVIRGGTVVSRSASAKMSVALKDGRIASILSDGEAPAAERTIDAEGLYVLPGVIDAHVHLRDPGPTHKEDFASGTAAAAAGGITCVFDMPNNVPPTRDPGSLIAKIEIARSKAVVDYGLYGLLGTGSLEEIVGMAHGGVIGFKCFMAETTGAIPSPSDGEMLEEFAEVARSGLSTAVHAENDSIVRYMANKLRSEGSIYPRAHYESRPEVAEEEAIARAVLFARAASCPLHVSHLSSEGGAELVRRAKVERQRITAETAPHYLLLDERRYADLGYLMKINPSIKSSSDRAALWDAISDGTVDMIASDHSPHALEEKAKDDIFEAASGFPGLETSLSLMLTQVNLGRLTIERYVQLSSANPARAWGVYPKKGCIEVGSDADITIVDMSARSKVDPSRFYSKAKWSPFEGYEVQGLPVYTISRGEVVMDHGVVESRGRGEMVVPIPRKGYVPLGGAER